MTAEKLNHGPDLTVRQFIINFESGFPRHWHKDAFRTQLFNALSMSFPAGEQSFIDSVRDCLPLLPADKKYDALRQSAKDFVAQEATHRHIHERYNAVLASQGLVNHWEHWITKRFAKFKAKGIHPLNFLASTVAYEHMTAILADVMFAHPKLLDSATPDMQALWRWHSSEESEHRSLAFDLYTALGGRYSNRIVSYLFAIWWFTTDVIAQTTHNLWRDKTLFKPSTWWHFLVYEFHPTQGIFWLMLPPMLTFFSRDFHPWKNRQQAPAQQWLLQNQARWKAITKTATSSSIAPAAVL
ncbi:MAG: metal-dependent hydrolase [Cytophagales bacterium]|nr:metal-dependent hydrolase [Cytophagales bacterium]